MSNLTTVVNNIISKVNTHTTALNTKVGKITSTDNAIARFDLTSGQIQDSGVIIDDNNNVGIGIAPSAWYGGYTRAIEIGNAPDNGTIWSSLNQNHSHIGIGANFYMDNSFIPKYKASYAASQYSQNYGIHLWQTAPSDTAGNAITWTNAMTLNASSNLAVLGNITANNGQSVLTDGGHNFAQNGYQKLSNGLIIQWGQATVSSSGGSATATFPIAFPTSCFQVVRAEKWSASYNYTGAISSWNNTSVTANNWNIGTWHYIAIGY